MGPKKKVFKSEWVESGAVNIEDTQPLLPQWMIGIRDTPQSIRMVQAWEEDFGNHGRGGRWRTPVSPAWVCRPGKRWPWPTGWPVVFVSVWGCGFLFDVYLWCSLALGTTKALQPDWCQKIDLTTKSGYGHTFTWSRVFYKYNQAVRAH
jgi:hypothetical protein